MLYPTRGITNASTYRNYGSTYLATGDLVVDNDDDEDDEVMLAVGSSADPVAKPRASIPSSCDDGDCG